MKVLFTTNLPSPYRVDFFNQLGKCCELTVAYERSSASDRDDKWTAEKAYNYNEVFLELEAVGTDRAKGNALKKFIKSRSFDIIIFTNYVSPATMSAITSCRISKTDYYIEYDGGFNEKDRFPKNLIKKFLLCGAKGHFTTCDEHIDYLRSLGVPDNIIYKYHFTSLKSVDLLADVPSPDRKDELRRELNISEPKTVTFVGRFIPGKGVDTLIKAASKLDRSIGFYIIGGTPTAEYSELCDKYNLNNIHFLEFMERDKLRKWYSASNLFILPTRKDVWGLVINEAMACGLPIITTNQCISGTELVKNGENGYIVDPDDADAIAQYADKILSGGLDAQMGRKSLEIISNYTIEKMAAEHIQIFEEILKGKNI